MVAVINEKEMKKWRESIGSLSEVTILISQKLKCSLSKAEKVGTCRYQHLSPEDQINLADLTKIPFEVLFQKKKKKAS